MRTLSRTSSHRRPRALARLASIALASAAVAASGAAAAVSGRPSQDAPSSAEDAPLRLPIRLQLVPPPDPLPPADEEELEREREILEKDFPVERKRITDLRGMLSLDPANVRLRQLVGQELFGLDLFGLAERELLQVVARDADAVRAHLLLGEIYRWRSDQGRALYHLEKVRTLDPRSAEACGLEAAVLLESGDPESARLLIDHSLRHAPFDAGLNVLRGNLLFDAGELEEARKALERGLATNPDHLKGHMVLGQVLFALGEEERAQEEMLIHERLRILRRAGAFKLNEELPEWKRAAIVASHFSFMGQNDRARAELERSHALSPGNPEARVVEADLRLREGSPQDALAILADVLAGAPRHIRALRLSAEIRLFNADATVHDPAEARRLATLALQNGARDDPYCWTMIGVAERELGNPDVARRFLRRALLLQPWNLRAQRELEALEEPQPATGSEPPR